MILMRYCASLLILVLAAAGAEVRMTVEQLKSFIQSSRRLGHSDKQVADYLKNVKITQRLEPGVVEELQAGGAGSRTVEALQKLAAETKSMPAPPPPKPKPVAAPIPPPDALEQGKVLDHASEYARDYIKRLPNFICTQVTRRYIDPSGLEFWRSQDVIVSKLSFFEQKEDYKVVLVNSQPVNTSMHRVGGTTTTGEFGTLLKDLFDSATGASFDWERWGTLRGKRAYVFSYRVPQERSKYTITYERTHTTTPGYTGLIYVDRDTMAIMRVTQDILETPPGFPITMVRNVLDYDYIDIAGEKFVLPLKASTVSRMAKTMFKNDTEFRMYNRFGTESTITFAPDPLPEDQVPAEAPPAEAPKR
jgi:hypothetical protein